MVQIKKDSNSFASYRVFELLKFLSMNSADVQDIIKHMELIDRENKSYSVATVYKYLTTLKTMGIEIIKINNKFHISKLPFTFDFSKEEIRAIKLIDKLTPFIAEKKLKADLQKLLAQLMPKLSQEMKNYFDKILIRNIDIPRIFTEKEIAQINEFEKFLSEDFKLNLTYINNDNELIKLCVEPVEIVYKEKDVYFTVFESKKGNILTIKLEKIIELVQSPQKSHRNFVPITTTFILKGKLIKRYVLKNGEKSIGFDERGNLIILSQKEDKMELTKRLLGYGALCEVISPKNQRMEIIQELDEMIKNYN